MARLILLNGPPGLGKSTLAQLYADEHPLALNLDIDRVRALLGRWPDHAGDAGLLTRDLALAMARTHLDAGHDVIVAQYLGRLTFVEQVTELAAETGADFYELVLLDTRENSIRRFMAREDSHAEAAAQVERAGGVAALEEMYDRLLAVIAARPATRIVPTTDGQVRAAYEALLSQLRADSL